MGEENLDMCGRNRMVGIIGLGDQGRKLLFPWPDALGLAIPSNDSDDRSYMSRPTLRCASIYQACYILSLIAMSMIILRRVLCAMCSCLVSESCIRSIIVSVFTALPFRALRTVPPRWDGQHSCKPVGHEWLFLLSAFGKRNLSPS